MNLDNILQDDHWMFIDDSRTISFYSLEIGLESYFSTYYSSYRDLPNYTTDDKCLINSRTYESEDYIKCYMNIAIHIQHFFELETKRILEEMHPLYSLDNRGDPLLLYSILNGLELNNDIMKKYKSVEFSEAIDRLGKLVNKNIITDQVGVLFVDNIKLLKALNHLRNTISHRGKRIMQYCDLDEFFTSHLLPFIKTVLECDFYKDILSNYKINGFYDAIDKLIKEGNKTTYDYSQIALIKEIARCKKHMRPDEIESAKEDIEKKIRRRIELSVDGGHLEGEKCPCCNNESLFLERDFIGYEYDELGDEMSPTGGFQIIKIPEFFCYTQCVLCGFTYSDFIKLKRMKTEGVLLDDVAKEDGWITIL